MYTSINSIHTIIHDVMSRQKRRDVTFEFYGCPDSAPLLPFIRVRSKKARLGSIFSKALSFPLRLRSPFSSNTR